VARRRSDLTDDLAAATLELDDPDAAASLGHNDRTPTSVRRRLAVRPDPQVRASAARRGLPENIPPGREVPRTFSRVRPTTASSSGSVRPLPVNTQRCGASTPLVGQLDHEDAACCAWGRR